MTGVNLFHFTGVVGQAFEDLDQVIAKTCLNRFADLTDR